MQYVNLKFPDKIVDANDGYVCPVSGTQYPKNWDKSTIPGLTPVADAHPVDRALFDVGPRTLDLTEKNIPRWVYAVTPLSEEESKSREEAGKRQEAINAIQELERKLQTPRAIRGAILGQEEDIARLKELETAIRALRQNLGLKPGLDESVESPPNSLK